VRLDVAGVADRQQRRFGLFQFRAFLMDSEKGKEKKKKMSKGGHFSLSPNQIDACANGTVQSLNLIGHGS
jgi:hypothetical protein